MKSGPLKHTKILKKKVHYVRLIATLTVQENYFPWWVIEIAISKRPSHFKHICCWGSEMSRNWVTESDILRLKLELISGLAQSERNASIESDNKKRLIRKSSDIKYT